MEQNKPSDNVWNITPKKFKGGTLKFLNLPFLFILWEYNLNPCIFRMIKHKICMMEKCIYFYVMNDMRPIS